MSPGLDVLRASYRDLKKGRQLLKPNQVYELHLDNLITSNVFRKGHRIRVQISATFFPNFSRNLQTGELEASSARMQKANISIYTDRRRPSRIVLPIVSRQCGVMSREHLRRRSRQSEESLPHAKPDLPAAQSCRQLPCRLPCRAQREPVLKQIDLPHSLLLPRNVSAAAHDRAKRGGVDARFAAAWCTRWPDRCGGRSSTRPSRSN